jgi:hypothetical protein
MAREQLWNEFTAGWYEYAEYWVSGELHVAKQWQESLIRQLAEYNRQTMRGRKATNGPGSKALHPPMPVDVEAMELHEKACQAAMGKQWGKLRELRGLIRRYLDYDSGTILIAGTVCHHCEGPLVVARDASSDVRCTQCGHAYPRHDWLSLLGNGGHVSGSGGEHTSP